MPLRTYRLSWLLLLVVTWPITLTRGDSPIVILEHDWTIRGADMTWGLMGWDSVTVVCAGSAHFYIPLPFIAVSALLAGGLALAALAGLWLASKGQVRR